MKITWSLFCVLTLLGQKELDSTVPETPEQIRVLAIEASNEGRLVPSVDPTLSSVRTLLDTLPYDTFHELAFEDKSVAYGDEIKFVLTPDYTLRCKPLRLTDSGEVVLEAHVDMKTEEGIVEALRVTGRAARGHGMIFRGFSLGTGEMLVVLSVADGKNEDESGGGAGGSDGDEEAASATDSQGAMSEENSGEGSQDGSLAEETKESDGEEKEEDRRKPRMPRTADGDPTDEVALPPELANLEGILRALEEIDRKEQAQRRKNGFDARAQREWW